MDLREAERGALANESEHWWIRTRLHYLGSNAERAVERFGRIGVLEMGCGTAQNIQFLRREWHANASVRKVVGVDPEHRAETRAGWMEPTDRVVKTLDDIDSKEAFEMLVAMDVLEHVGDDRGALRDWVARLVPRGIACITVPAFQWLWSYHDEVLGHKRRYTREALLEVTSAAGLRPIGAGYIFSWLLPVAYAVRVGLRGRSRATTSDLAPTPIVLNRLLTEVGKLEVGLGANRYFGTSVVGVFEKAD